MVDKGSGKRDDIGERCYVGRAANFLKFVLVIEEVCYRNEIMRFPVFKELNHCTVDTFMRITIEIVWFQGFDYL